MGPHRPRRRFGQNFLIDRGAARRIVDTLELTVGDPVLEIGPGTGALTGALIEAAGRIAAVEIDNDLAQALRQRFDEAALLLYETDVLGLDLLEIRSEMAGTTNARLRVAGNLPYNISKPFAMKLVLQADAVECAVLMFQREVAQRLTACAGSRSYGPLTVLAGTVYEITRVFELGPRAFRPPPKVHSTVTLWRRRNRGPHDALMMVRLRACLAASFARRRQTLHRNLRASLGAADAASELLRRAEIDGRARPEQVSPEGFLRLAAAWPSRSSGEA